jgi:hypothetical protein
MRTEPNLGSFLNETRGARNLKAKASRCLAPFSFNHLNGTFTKMKTRSQNEEEQTRSRGYGEMYEKGSWMSSPQQERQWERRTRCCLIA